MVYDKFCGEQFSLECVSSSVVLRFTQRQKIKHTRLFQAGIKTETNSKDSRGQSVVMIDSHAENSKIMATIKTRLMMTF